MNQNDPLAKYRKKKTEPGEQTESKSEQVQSSPQAQDSPQESDPLAKYRKTNKKESKLGRDVVSKQLREQGVEPDFSEEIERQSERGVAEAQRGLLSGATLGISKLAPILEPEEGLATDVMELTGSFLPIGFGTKGIQWAGRKLFSKPLMTIAKKSPLAAKSLGALGNLTGVGTVGATVAAAEEATSGGQLKAPSVDNMLEHGATWVALDAALSAVGATGRFTKSLIRKAKSGNKSRAEILDETLKQLRDQGVDISTDEKVAEKALSILENKPIQSVEKEIKLSNEPVSSKEKYIFNRTLTDETKKLGTDLKTKKVEQQHFDKLDKETDRLAEPYFPNQFQAVEIAEEAINKEVDAAIDSIAPRAETEQQLGKNVQTALEDTRNAAAAEYNPLYKEAEEAAKMIHVVPQETASKASQLIQKLEGIKVKPQGYAKVIQELENAMEDAGFVIRRSEEGAFVEAVSAEEVSLSKIMELKRRLNKMANFDNIESSIQDLLGTLAASTKQDVLKGLGKNKKALDAFQKAEKLFGETANKFKRKSVKGARYSEKPESIAKLIRTPSGLEDLKKVVSPEQFAQIERELLEHMKSLPEDRAKSFYREMRPHLSADTRSVSEQIIESKAAPASPTKSVAQRNKIQQGIYDDLSKASITGQRPETSLKLWKTREGQQLIKNSLKGNPNEKEILKYLEDQSLADFSVSVVSPDGKIDFKKFNQLMRDPATVENLRLVGGEDAVAFFKQLESLSSRMDRNVSAISGKIDKSSPAERKALDKKLTEAGNKILQRSKKLTPEQELFQKNYGPEAATERKLSKERINLKSSQEKADRDIKEKNKLINKFEDYVATYGTKTKTLLAALGISVFGPGFTVGAVAAYKSIKYLAKNQKVRSAIREAASKSTETVPLINAITKIDEASQE